jgi:predicted NAD/FAD-binding protein
MLETFTLAYRYSEGFLADYIVPMCAAIWSAPASKVLAFPVQMQVRFWMNHHLLNIFDRPLWRTVKDRSQAYVARALEGIQHVRTGTPVLAVRAVNTDGGAGMRTWIIPYPC